MLTVTDPAPDFSLPGFFRDSIRTFSLRQMRGKWVILFFYPADFTFVCPTEVVGFSQKAPEFHKEGAEIFGTSVDSAESHREWAKELGGIAYPLLSDQEKKVSKAYDVLQPQQGVALRATFIIDPEGIIQYGTVTSMNVGRSVEETLRVLQALRTGKLCPADWQPGDPTGDLTLKY